MATRTTTKNPAKDAKKPPATKRKAGSGSLASAAETAGRKRSVKAAQQRQRSDPEHAAVMSEHDAEQRSRMVAEAAYYRAKIRNFAPGHELDDWLDAEAEIDQRGPAT